MAHEPPAEAPAAVRAAAAVLVVDDNASKRVALTAMLAPLGIEVVEADSGRAALRAVLRQAFAVVLMDVRMPLMDGYETAGRIRQREKSELTPIIFVTAFGLDEIETAAAYASGAVDFLFTPVLPEVLRAKVSAFVALFLQAEALERSLESIGLLNESLRDSEVRAHAVVQNVADGIVTADVEGLIESCNESAQRLFGYRLEELVGEPLDLIIAPSHRGEFAALTSARGAPLTGDAAGSESVESVGCRKDGSNFPIEMDVRQMPIGERIFTVTCFRDISGRKAYNEALEQRTLHDELTGLPNRALFAAHLDRAIASGDRSGATRGVLVVGLDNFRAVNEKLGHDQGDALLKAVAGRLKALLHTSDTVARLRGDEFGVLPADGVDVETIEAIAWKVRKAFERGFDLGTGVFEVEASIGIAVFPQHGRATAELLRRAGVAMQQAKRSGKGLGVFVAEPEDRTGRRLALLSELREGIPRGELVLHYQPKIDLGPTRRTTGVEALVRWHHPTHGLLMPAQFIDEAERSEVIGSLTSWVLDQALRQQSLWRDAGLDLTMAVNIPARCLRRGSGLADNVARLTETWETVRHSLILELTESALIDADVPDVLDVLHAMGVQLSIDDFGTGHSSLVYLQRLPVDQIKVDRSFVKDLASAPNDAVIVRSTIDLAHNLGLTVVAEGVEDEVALNMLIESGCDTAQGYYFSRPRPPDELSEWLTESPSGVEVGAHH